MSESPNKPHSNGISPPKRTRQSKRLRGQDAPFTEPVAGARSPRKSPSKTRARTVSQGSNGSFNAFNAISDEDLPADEVVESEVKTPNKHRKSQIIDFEQSDDSPAKLKSKMANKLNNSFESKLNSNEKQKSSGNRHKPESHSELLKQAVVSKDPEKFFTVICTLDNQSKRATIQELDATFVLPTIKYINEIFRDDKLRERTSYLRDFRFTIDFLKLVLELHSGYLSTLTGLDKHLGGLVEFAQTRSANIDKLNKLEGRLSFTYEQMKLRSDPVTFREQAPVVKFVDDDHSSKKKKKDKKTANLETKAATSEKKASKSENQVAQCGEDEEMDTD